MNAYLLNKTDIEQCIPHGSNMSLLNGVISIDQKTVVCDAISHQDPKNPLLFKGSLSALTVAEYAGQAVALHRYHLRKNSVASLATPKEGYIAALKNVRFFVEKLTNITQTLQISANCIFIDANKALYEFSVSTASTSLAVGEMIVAEE